MSSNYQQKKMMNALGAIDTKGNIVLEQFQDGTALLFQPGNAQPFCVATDYDRATASWSYGKYFSDLGCAYEAADPEIIADASVRWVKEDIREKLKAQGIAPTEFNVQSVIMGDSRLWERPLDRDFRDNMIVSGNDDLDARVTILKENGTSRMSIPQCRWKVLMIWNNTGLIGLRIRSRHLKTVLMHNIRQMSVVAFSTVHVKYLTTVISTNIK